MCSSSLCCSCLPAQVPLGHEWEDPIPKLKSLGYSDDQLSLQPLNAPPPSRQDADQGSNNAAYIDKNLSDAPDVEANVGDE